MSRGRPDITIGTRVYYGVDPTVTGTVTNWDGHWYTVDWDKKNNKQNLIAQGWHDAIQPIVEIEYPTETSKREEILDGAKEAVMKQRNNTYGPPTQDFDTIAQILTAQGFRRVAANGDVEDIKSHNVAEMMIALKLARLHWSPDHKDSWLDIAGYAACGYECV